MEPGAVLVVDDDVTLTRSLAHALEGFGWSVDVASDGRTALQILGERHFDALVLSLHMPETDGLSLIERVRELPSRPVALLLSGQLDVPTAVRAVRAGAYDVIEKPALPAHIDERLRAALGVMTAERAAARAIPADAASRIIGETPGMCAVREQVRNVARYRDLSVVVIGETGTEKELVAESVHALTQADAPWVTVNCAAIPEQLMEGELFGHEAGAFSSSGSAQTGLFELAGAGTLFFDEIGDLPPQIQPKLLRVLESRTFRRVGGWRDVPFRARVVSATSRRVNGSEGALRSDLYFRLSGFTILIPSLRDRVADIELIAGRVLEDFAEQYPGAPGRIAPRALEELQNYEWPGNVRELKVVVQQAGVLTRGPVIGVDEVCAVLRERRAENELSPLSSSSRASGTMPLSEPLRVLERRVIEEAWQTSGQNLSAAARKLGLPRTTLRDRLRKYGLR